MYQANNIEKLQGEHSVVENTVHKKTHHYAKLIIGSILWLLAVACMILLSVFVHAHPQPTPFELTISRNIQAIPFPPFIRAIMRWFTAINDPIPDVITVCVVIAILALIRKFKAATFLTLSAGIGNAVDALIGDVVKRPRPSVHLLHVDSLLKFNSFPSGHSCHMMVFYGFLLYLSLTKPVRQWKYHWALLPLQIYAVVTILIMGFARLWEGEHWIADVVGGYLDGLIWMVLFIALYNWTTEKLQERQERKTMKQGSDMVQ